MKDNERPRVRIVPGGAPGLGKRSSRWYDPEKAKEEFPLEHESEVEEPTPSAIDPIEMIDIMLKNPRVLNQRELQWVRDIDKTVADFEGPTQLTQGQRKVIVDIFRKYQSRNAS